MKAIVFISVFFISLLYSASSESRIISLIFNSLYSKDAIVYTEEEDKIKIIKEAGFDLADSCEDATLFFSSYKIENCQDRPLFTSSYKVLKEDQNAIGAFYWKKGRPNIIFVKSRLEYFELKLPTELKKYEVTEL